MKNKVVIILCLVLMIAILVPVMVKAEIKASGTCGEGVSWSLDNHGTLTISGMGKMADYANYSAVPWKDERTFIEEVVILDGVTSIGNRAFYNCTELREISLAATLREIGSYAFSGCVALEEISLPDELSEIGNRAFYNCKSLRGISIPDCVEVLKNSTFAKCSSLSTVKLGDGVCELEDSVFEDCGELEKVTLGENLEVFGEDIFTGCSDALILTAYHDTPAADYCATQPYAYEIKCKAEFYSDSILVLESEYLLGDFMVFPENTITKEGYDFRGWDVGGVIYREGDKVEVNARLNINAVWEMQTFSIMFETGMAENPKPATKKYWEDLALDVSPAAREGYDFLGWSTVRGAETVEYAPGASFVTNENTVLYAVWKEKTYTITFNIPEAENKIENQIKKHTANLKLTSTLPIRSGYTFIGWSRKQEAVIPEFQPGTMFDINADTDLYAVWVSGIISGDADNNGKVEMADLIKMIEYVNNHKTEFTKDNLAAMDVFKDTNVNIKDVLKLAQYLSDWSNVVLGE